MPSIERRDTNIPTSKLDKSPIKSESFSQFYEAMQADRKTRSQIEGADIEKARENIDKAIDFSTQLMLAAAKNMGFPDGDGSSNKSKEMSDAANSIAQMMATKASIGAQMAAIEAQKNPVVDLMSLKDKIVEYKDDTRGFIGEPVTYNYKVSHEEASPSAVVNLTFTIRDKEGLAVRTVRQTGKVGEHKFVWDGKNDKGQTMLPGSYTLDLRAEGRKTENGTSITFPVKAGAVLSGVVESIKFDNGVAVGVMINGNLIKRDQISNVRDFVKPKEDNTLNPDLIGKLVELDFSRAQVKNGSLEVYFNNHIENSGKVTVKIYDESGQKYIKTLEIPDEISDEIEVGIGKLSPQDHGLEDGNYSVKVYIADISDKEEPVDVELKYKTKLMVAGINSRAGTFMSTEEDVYSPHNIDSIVGNYTTRFNQRKEDFDGAEVKYKDDLFTFAVGAAAKTLKINKPEEEAVISHGEMTIYDPVTSDLVATVKGEYRPYDYLDDPSRLLMDNLINRKHDGLVYDALSKEQRLEINRRIEAELLAPVVDILLPLADPLLIVDPLDPPARLALQPQYQEDYDDAKALITFSVWDGMLSDGTRAVEGKEYMRQFTAVYSKANGEVFSGETGAEFSTDMVEFIEEQGRELSLTLASGKVISEERVVHVKPRRR